MEKKSNINIFFRRFEKVDFDKVFKKEGVTKWRDGNEYGIHAWGYEKLYEYLKMVVNEIKAS